jgi:hypothetical protein
LALFPNAWIQFATIPASKGRELLPLTLYNYVCDHTMQNISE